MADNFTFQVPAKPKDELTGQVLFVLVVYPETVLAKWNIPMRQEALADAHATETIVNILKDQIRLLEKEHAATMEPPGTVVN